MEEFHTLKRGKLLPKSSRLLPFCHREHSVIRVGGRMNNSALLHSQSHPMILDGKHTITKSIILSEHLCLMHAGPTLLLSSLNNRLHIISAQKTVRSITRQCITLQMVTLPNHNINYLNSYLMNTSLCHTPLKIRCGLCWTLSNQIWAREEATIVQSYICLFVCLVVKVVHLELVSDLTTEAFVVLLPDVVVQQWSRFKFCGSQEWAPRSLIQPHCTRFNIWVLQFTQHPVEVHSTKVSSTLMVFGSSVLPRKKFQGYSSKAVFSPKGGINL